MNTVGNYEMGLLRLALLLTMLLLTKGTDALCENNHPDSECTQRANDGECYFSATTGCQCTAACQTINLCPDHPILGDTDCFCRSSIVYSKCLTYAAMCPRTCHLRSTVICDSLPNVSGAVHSTPSTKYLDVVTYDCLPGYYLVNGSTGMRVCKEDGSWFIHVTNGTLPVCEKIPCGASPTVAHAVPSQPDGVYGDVISFSCDNGFEQVAGEEGRVYCNATGQWEAQAVLGEPPVCQEVTTLPTTTTTTTTTTTITTTTTLPTTTTTPTTSMPTTTTTPTTSMPTTTTVSTTSMPTTTTASTTPMPTTTTASTTPLPTTTTASTTPMPTTTTVSTTSMPTTTTASTTPMPTTTTASTTPMPTTTTASTTPMPTTTTVPTTPLPTTTTASTTPMPTTTTVPTTSPASTSTPDTSTTDTTESSFSASPVTSPESTNTIPTTALPPSETSTPDTIPETFITSFYSLNDSTFLFMQCIPINGSRPSNSYKEKIPVIKKFVPELKEAENGETFGAVAIIILVSCMMSIVIIDLLSIGKHIGLFKKNMNAIKQRFQEDSKENEVVHYELAHREGDGSTVDTEKSVVDAGDEATTETIDPLI